MTLGDILEVAAYALVGAALCLSLLVVVLSEIEKRDPLYPNDDQVSQKGTDDE